MAPGDGGDQLYKLSALLDGYNWNLSKSLNHEDAHFAVSSLVTVIAIVLGIRFVCLPLIWSFRWASRWESSRELKIGEHHWTAPKTKGPYFCNLCNTVVYGIRSQVVGCQICGAYAHASCVQSSRKIHSLHCKSAGVIDGKPVATVFRHEMVKGNIDALDVCQLCGLFCGSILAFRGVRCMWCHRAFHEDCYAKTNQDNHICDFSPFREMIVLPQCVLMKPLPHRDRTPATRRMIRRMRSEAKKLNNYIAERRRRWSEYNSQPPESPLPSSPSKSSLTALTNGNDPIGNPQETLPILPPSPPPTLAATSSSGSSQSGKRKLKPRKKSFVGAELEKIAETHTGSSPAIAGVTDYEIRVEAREHSPLLVFINSGSGGQLGIDLLDKFRSWLNPLQVVDLAIEGPGPALRRFVPIPRLKILVCGGDGSVGWILSALDEFQLDRQPPVAVVPLGTGNDLARVLGWGGGFTYGSIKEILRDVSKAHVGFLDRWKVTFAPKESGGKKSLFLNNYLGLGVDAQIAHEFHEMRRRTPFLFMSQFINKVWYARFGTKNFLVRNNLGLANDVDIYCDGRKIQIPDGAEGLIICNVDSFAGGAKLWHHRSEEELDHSSNFEPFLPESEDDDDFQPSAHDDGMLEVVAVYGAFHLGQMQIGLARAVRLCQCSSIKVVTKNRPIAMQVDGEPWIQPPCEVDIAFHNQAVMLYRTLEERGEVLSDVTQVLEWAEFEGVISARQRDLLLTEIIRRAHGKGRSSSSSSLSASHSSSRNHLHSSNSLHKLHPSRSRPLLTTSEHSNSASPVESFR